MLYLSSWLLIHSFSWGMHLLREGGVRSKSIYVYRGLQSLTNYPFLFPINGANISFVYLQKYSMPAKLHIPFTVM